MADLDDDFIQSATVVAPPESEATPVPPSPVYHMPKIEPEIIKQWREEFKLRTQKIEEDSDLQVKMHHFVYLLFFS